MNTPSPGSLSGLRESNKRRLLATLDGSVMRQADLARATGLSAAAVSGLVRELLDEGSVVIRDGSESGQRGRFVERVPVTPAVGIGIDLGRTHVRLVLGTGVDDVWHEREFPIPLRAGPKEVVPIIADMALAACRDAAVDIGEVSSAGLGLPGPVDIDRGTVVGGAILSEWDGFPIRDMLADALSCETYVDNDANMGVTAIGARADSSSGVVYLKIGSGIGAGIMVDGAVLHGNASAVGEIGHLNVDPTLAVICRCGRRGCLETLSSAEAITASMATALEREVGIDEVINLVEQGHPVAIALLKEAGHSLGRGLGWLAMIVNPSTVVIGGPMQRAGAPLLAAIQSGFEQSTLPRVHETTDLQLSPYGDRTEAFGALLAGLRSAQRSAS